MTKTEQTRLGSWRLKTLQRATTGPRNVARTCRYFGVSRKTFYKWKGRHATLGDATLCDKPRTPHKSPRATPRDDQAFYQLLDKNGLSDDIRL